MKRTKSFRHELLSGLVLASLVPLVFCSIFMIRFFRGRIESDYEDEATARLQTVTGVLDDFVTEIDGITADFAVNADIQDNIYASDIERQKLLYQAMYDRTGDVREYADFAIYALDGSLKYATDGDIFDEELPLYIGILYEARNAQGGFVMCVNKDYRGGSGVTSLTCARLMRDQSGTLTGYAVAAVTAEGFGKVLLNELGRQNKLYLFDEYWNLVYASDDASAHSVADTLREHLMITGEVYGAGGDEKFYPARVGNYMLYIVLEQHEIFTEGIVARMYGISVIIAGLCLILCIISSSLLSKYLNEPVSRLTRAMKRVEEGDLDVVLETDRKDEFGVVAGSFNKMTGELKNNIEERVAAQKELDEAHAATMQAQLNPHFLYNTLDTIKWVAKANNVPEIATMSSGLAKILRTSISGSRSVTLKEELEFVRSYVKIQQIRFSDRFEYVENVGEDYYDCEVPKLILQPLVENAIVHGIGESEKGIIELTAATDPESYDLLLTVTDNGRGISDEMLQAVNSHDHETLSGHHGVYNVDTMIRLNYGTDYGVTASRRTDGAESGTVMTVRLPRSRVLGR